MYSNSNKSKKMIFAFEIFVIKMKENMQFIDVQYATDDVEVSFRVAFGKGKDSYNVTCYERTNYSTPYNIEKHSDGDVNMYCLLAEEGPFVLEVTDVNVVSKTGMNRRKTHDGYVDYKYGIACVLDMNKEPVYDGCTDFTPSIDIERDGKAWVIFNGKTIRVDQNGEAMFQWSTARALDKGVKPTAEQELMGVEERHENSGMIYITFQPIYIEEVHQTVKQELTRGLTRVIGPSQETRAARVGYGSKAQTASKRTSTIPIPSSRYVLPIRIRNIGKASPDTKCAKDLKSAMRVEELQKRTGVLPDYE